MRIENQSLDFFYFYSCHLCLILFYMLITTIHRIKESFGLGNTFKIIQSNCKLAIAIPITKTCPLSASCWHITYHCSKTFLIMHLQRWTLGCINWEHCWCSTSLNIRYPVSNKAKQKTNNFVMKHIKIFFYSQAFLLQFQRKYVTTEL